MSSRYSSETEGSSASLLTPQAIYVRTGLGGAGNYHKTPSKSTRVSSRSPVSTKTDGLFSIGIGGAGNFKNYDSRVIISPEEEMERNKLYREKSSPRRRSGIGGAGNFAKMTASGADSITSSDSDRSKSSGADRMKSRMSTLFQ